MVKVPAVAYRGTISRRRALDSLKKLPAMSASAGRLLGRLSRKDCDVADVAALIEKDPVLSAQVVQSANSAAFKRTHQVESVRHAIVMVGLGTVRRFALIQTISNLFSRRRPADNFSMTRFNLHSVAVGTMMEVLAEEAPLEDAAGAFLSGLFHDVGSLLIAVAMPDQYESVLALAAVTGRELVDCEEGVLGTNHAELSALALEYWGVEEPFRTAAADHHSLEPAAFSPSDRIPLTLALHQADTLIDKLGMSIDAPRDTAQPAPKIEFAGHSVDQERLLERFAVEWKAVDAMLR